MLQLDPSLTFEFVLDAERLRSFNLGAAEGTGFPVKVMTRRTRKSRDNVVRYALGKADLIIEDTCRFLIPYRHLTPNAAWVSIPLYPVVDELFLDWPHLAQTDGIVWAYAPFMGLPPELEIPAIQSKVLATGPFVEVESVPPRPIAREQLGLSVDEEIVVYAPRGMPFGREFGEKILGSTFGALKELRAQGRPVRLILLAVNNRDELRCPGFPDDLPDWVSIVGVVSPPESLLYERAADIVIAEGTSTAHEAAALGTPLVMVPGMIHETWLLGTKLSEHNAAWVRWIEGVSTEVFVETFERILTDSAECERRCANARDVVMGGGGAGAAAKFILDIAREFHAKRENVG